jgi:hypothetical protein
MTNCNQCGQEAEFAVCSLISTKGKSPRRQKCSKSVGFCASCIQGALTRGEGKYRPALQDAFVEAYIALVSDSVNDSDRSNRQ